MLAALTTIYFRNPGYADYRQKTSEPLVHLVTGNRVYQLIKELVQRRAVLYDAQGHYPVHNCIH